jgi:predicted outer membrane repeat protein
MRPLLLACLILVSGADAALSATFVVPDSFPTIQAALAVAASGDTVLVRSGTYPETLVLVDGVVLRGEDPLDPPVIDGMSSGPVLTAIGCGGGTRVEDVVVTNGAGLGLGGGATLEASSVVFSGCRFTSNLADLGGGIGGSDSDFTVIACVFENNHATQSGGAISVTDLPSPQILDSTFRGNSANVGGAIAVRNGCEPQISGCLVEDNVATQGAAVWFDFLTGGGVSSCTIVDNDATSASGGALYFNPLADPTISACIVALSRGGSAMFVAGGAEPEFGCCDVWGNVGGNAIGGIDLGTNIHEDPRFCAPGSSWELQDISPCLPDGECGLRGAFGEGCTAVGAGAGLETVSWGRAKALFR